MCETRLVLVFIAVLWLWPVELRAQSAELSEAYGRGTELYEAGRYDRAMPFWRRAVELSEREFGPDDPRTVVYLNSLAELHRRTQNYGESERLLERALAIVEAALPPGHPYHAQALNSLATLYLDTGRYGEAERLYQRALAIREAALPPGHPDVAQALNNIATLYLNTGRYVEAEPLLERALAIREAALPPGHPDVANSLNNLAGLYLETDRYAEAEPLYERALAILEAALPPGHPDVTAQLNNLAMVYQATGRYGDAERLYERALTIIEATWPPGHPYHLQALTRLATLYRATGRYREAEPLYERALAILEAALPPGHPHLALALNELGLAYLDTGRHGDAESLLERALAIREAALGPTHPEVATQLNNLASVYQATGRYGDAEPLLKRALAIREEALPPGHPDVANSLNNLAMVYRDTGRYAQAEPLFERAVDISERTLDPRHPALANRLSNLAGLYRATGRYGEAERLYERALAIRDAALPPGHPDLALALNNLALVYLDTGRDTAAERLYQRALAIREAALGPKHAELAVPLNNLAMVYQATGRYGEAERVYQRALAIREAALPPGHPDVAQALNNLALVYLDIGRYAEAEPLLERALAIREAALGPEHAELAVPLSNLAGLYRATGRYAEAEPLYERALAIREAALPPGHPGLAEVLSNLAALHRDQGQHREALDHIRKASAIYGGRAVRSSTARSITGQAELADTQYLFRWHATMAAEHAEEEPDQRTALAAEAFEAAQLARATGTASAVSRMAARFAAGGDALARAVREQQDLVAQWQASNAALIEAVSRSPDERVQELEANLRRELETVGLRLDELDARIAREFPEYAGLVSPEPLAVARVQELLRPDEALVTFLIGLIGTEQTYAWLVRADRLEMRALGIAPAALAEAVAALRRGLDPAGGRGAPRLEELHEEPRGAERPADGRSVVGRFDVDLAHALYEKLWAPLEPFLDGVQHAIVVPDGPLESLPLQVLVKAKPDKQLREPQELRAVAWLAKRPYALSVLPAVGALRGLRELALGTPPGAGFLGFGDPLIGDASAARCLEPAPEELVVAELTEAQQRGGVNAELVQLFRGGGWQDGVPVADVEAVRRLTRLPDSRCELQALARSLGAGEGALYLDAAATEAAVKGLSATGELRGAGVLAFATHGLIAGDLDGLAEPALVLTPPAKGSAEDDGLLTASEVAGLDLNAEWLILSACNTAAADGRPGAEGLSGLARAFFYAGARALLVSHWSVYSPAAVALTTGTLEALRREPSLGRAEALRRTMVKLIADGPNPHPSYWAPFVVVGG